jgi:predicted deacylase
MTMQPTVRRCLLGLAGLEVPAVELTGSGDGPRLTVLAGVHGCEYAPMAAVRRWVRQLAQRELRGRVVAVPVLNLPAFQARTPFVVPGDGKNLNRCFPGDPAGTLADRLAHAAFTELIAGADAVVDVHAGDLVEALEPFALYDAGPAEDRARDLAAAYGLGYLIRQEPGPDRAVGGTTSAAAAALGIPAFIAEAGGCGLVEEAAVQAHLRGLDGVLAALGMTTGAGGQPAEASRREPVHLQRFIWLRCAHAGWWEPAVRPGERVAAGQLLGMITTLDGTEVLQEITAPVAGVPMFVTSSPAVAADGLLLGLGARSAG